MEYRWRIKTLHIPQYFYSQIMLRKIRFFAKKLIIDLILNYNIFIANSIFYKHFLLVRYFSMALFKKLSTFSSAQNWASDLPVHISSPLTCRLKSIPKQRPASSPVPPTFSSHPLEEMIARPVVRSLIRNPAKFVVISIQGSGEAAARADPPATNRRRNVK